MKGALKARFQTWYTNEMQPQDVSIEVKIDVTITVIKGLSANWIISAWNSIAQRPELTVNGFRKAGILSAIAAVRD